MTSKIVHCVRCEESVVSDGFMERMESGLCMNCQQNLSPYELKREGIKAAYKEMEAMGHHSLIHYGTNGKPIRGWEWAWMMETGRNKISSTRIWPRILVSTVLLGIDHRLAFFSRPVIFETMVFSPWEEQGQERHCTLQEATMGHQRLVNRWRWRRWLHAPRHLLLMAGAVLRVLLRGGKRQGRPR